MSHRWRQVLGPLTAAALDAAVVWAPAGASAAVSCIGHGSFSPGTLGAVCTIDQGITGIHVVAVGAPGGSAVSVLPGGKGAVVSADIPISAGASLFVNVGGAGADSGGIGSGGVGAANGGGQGGNNGAGGGGSSDLRMPTDAPSDRFLVAAGGGGGGSGYAGGDADAAAPDPSTPSGGSASTNGVDAVGGRGGGDSPCRGQPGFNSSSGGAAGAGYSGTAGTAATGGGGGGYAGGGGGGENWSAPGTCDDVAGGGGGGGGVSLIRSGASSAIDTTGTPVVVITAPVPSSSSRPVVNGVPKVGHTLTEAPGSWSNSPTSVAVHWLRCDSNGAGCASVGTGAESYVLSSDDLGHTIEAQETATNFYGSSLVAGSAGTGTSDPSGVVGQSLSLLRAPTISGALAVGATLGEINATWSDPPISVRSYQWSRCDSGGNDCQTVDGATSQNYALTAADLGHTMVVAETATNDYGTSLPAASVPTGAIGEAPLLSSAPAINGAPSIDRTLDEVNATWSDPPISARSYQWSRCDTGGKGCQAVSGATGQTYALTTADLGHSIIVAETATNAYGTSNSATSAATEVVGAPPSASARPSINGTARQGKVLVEAHAAWSNPPLTTYSYQWLRCTATDTRCAPIARATNQSYALTVADVDYRIAVDETAANVYGPGISIRSQATATVAPSVSPSARIGGARTVLLGQPTHFQASVADSLGAPSTFRWTLNGHPVGTHATLNHTFNQLGKQILALTIVDTAGHTIRVRYIVLVKPQTLGVGLPWLATTYQHPPVSVFTSLVARSVPASTRITLRCRGDGCPFRSHTLVTRASAIHPGRRTTVNLLPLLHDARMAAGDQLIVRFEKRSWISTIYTFAIGRREPVRTKSCQAPSRKQPSPC